MSTTGMKRRAKTLIDGLNGPQLRAATEFFAFAKAREADDATLELLAIPGFERSFRAGLRDVRAGRTTSWRTVRRDV